MKQSLRFESKLRAAKKKGEMVIVAGHIPPGVFFGKTDWQPWAQKRYIEVAPYVMVVIKYYKL